MILIHPSILPILCTTSSNYSPHKPPLHHHQYLLLVLIPLRIVVLLPPRLLLLLVRVIRHSSTAARLLNNGSFNVAIAQKSIAEVISLLPVSIVLKDTVPCGVTETVFGRFKTITYRPANLESLLLTFIGPTRSCCRSIPFTRPSPKMDSTSTFSWFEPLSMNCTFSSFNTFNTKFFFWELAALKIIHAIHPIPTVTISRNPSTAIYFRDF